MTTGKGEQTKRPHRAGSDEVKDSLPRSQIDPSGPVRWRVDIAGCEPDLYSDRRKAVAAAKRARLKGHAVTLTRIEAVSRRWRIGDVACHVWRDSLSRGWSWSADIVVAGWRETYAEAVEAAERATRGQR